MDIYAHVNNMLISTMRGEKSKSNLSEGSRKSFYILFDQIVNKNLLAITGKGGNSGPEVDLYGITLAGMEYCLLFSTLPQVMKYKLNNIYKHNYYRIILESSINQRDYGRYRR